MRLLESVRIELARLRGIAAPEAHPIASPTNDPAALLPAPTAAVGARRHRILLRTPMGFIDMVVGRNLRPTVPAQGQAMSPVFIEMLEASTALSEELGGAPNFPDGRVSLAGKLTRRELQGCTDFEHLQLSIQGFAELEQISAEVARLDNHRCYMENPGTQLLERRCGFTMHADRPGIAAVLRDAPALMINAFQSAKRHGCVAEFFCNAFDRTSDPCLEGRCSLLAAFLADTAGLEHSDSVAAKMAEELEHEQQEGESEQAHEFEQQPEGDEERGVTEEAKEERNEGQEEHVSAAEEGDEKKERENEQQEGEALAGAMEIEPPEEPELRGPDMEPRAALTALATATLAAVAEEQAQIVEAQAAVAEEQAQIEEAQAQAAQAGLAMAAVAMQGEGHEPDEGLSRESASLPPAKRRCVETCQGTCV
mmetsp:Transcript_30903/g.78124  ORF Transcript_30903/g.78124 Transcript_30903/m.78124 type:complete len:424 (-) Transcript_30903:23-1294(-)